MFKGKRIQPAQTTEEFPIQEFYWKDVYARLVAEKIGSRKFRYEVVPLGGMPGKLKPMTNFRLLISNESRSHPQWHPASTLVSTAD